MTDCQTLKNLAQTAFSGVNHSPTIIKNKTGQTRTWPTSSSFWHNWVNSVAYLSTGNCMHVPREMCNDFMRSHIYINNYLRCLVCFVDKVTCFATFVWIWTRCMACQASGKHDYPVFCVWLDTFWLDINVSFCERHVPAMQITMFIISQIDVMASRSIMSFWGFFWLRSEIRIIERYFQVVGLKLEKWVVQVSCLVKYAHCHRFSLAPNPQSRQGHKTTSSQLSYGTLPSSHHHTIYHALGERYLLRKQ